MDALRSLARQNWRSHFAQALSLGMVVSGALIVWKVLMLATGSESPVVVVLSGSMEPGFYKGDMLVLNMPSPAHPVGVGDIVVFNVEDKAIPIVHRVIEFHERRDVPAVAFDAVTKGDNNAMDDRLGGIYTGKMSWLSARHILGRVIAYVPYMGMMTIWMNESLAFKVGLIGFLGFMVLTTKD